MTREEEINKASDELFNSAPCSKTYKMGFEAGAMWADANPKSPWISVEGDLPYNHDELMENEHCTKSVLAVLVWNKDPSIRHIERCRMCDMLGSINMGWHWCNGGYYHVVYWMPLPEIPN